MRTKWLDDSKWLDLARPLGIKLPGPEVPCTIRIMRKMMRKTGFTFEQFSTWSGYENLSEWIKANPEWSARAFAGLILEEL